jgi:hypothetical protein
MVKLMKRNGMKPEGKKLSRGFAAYCRNLFLYDVGRAAYSETVI